jgi:hypothetical protein
MSRDRRQLAVLIVCGVTLAVAAIVPLRAAVDYPLSLTLDANASTPTLTIAASLIVRVDRLMLETRRKRVTDALTHSGYGNFLTALRSLPPIGAIALKEKDRSVEIRYAHEQPEGAGRRLLLVADRPLFFDGDPARNRTGYELTIVELHFDAQGAISGRMMGAARVKPSPEGVVVDNFASVEVQLTARTPRP